MADDDGGGGNGDSEDVSHTNECRSSSKNQYRDIAVFGWVISLAFYFSL